MTWIQCNNRNKELLLHCKKWMLATGEYERLENIYDI